MTNIFIIAEAGVNHNGNLKTAKQLIDVAVGAGADAVKFQTFKADKLVTQTAAKAGYQKVTTDAEENQLAMLQRLELKYEFHFELRDYCRSQNIQFLSTAFDCDSLEFLVNEVGIECLKIPSGEITNGPFLLAHAQTGKNVIVSTGMSTLGEVEEALGVLAFGYLQSSAQPGSEAFLQAYCSEEGQRQLKEKVTLLHCTSEYPAPLASVHLRVLDTLAQSFALPVGYSDHTEGIAIPIAAVARGACVLEKHFTLDKAMPGPDHKASLEPDELKAMVQAVRQVEQALGAGQKYPQAPEWSTRAAARKVLVASRPIRAGDAFSNDNLGIKRAGAGLAPSHYWSLLGQISDRAYQVDEVIRR